MQIFFLRRISSRRFLLVELMKSYLAVFIFACTLVPASSIEAQRIGPPATLGCSRDHLTAFIGRVAAYRRVPGRIHIRIRTDEETTENFTLRFARNQDGSRHFLMRGEVFRNEDWKHIEAGHGRLKPGMRAIVWVCDDGSTPVVDWRPAEQ